MSAREIAEKLCLSPNTVHTHVRRIYSKLGAHTREEAVAHARREGLIGDAAHVAETQPASGDELPGRPPPALRRHADQ